MWGLFIVLLHTFEILHRSIVLIAPGIWGQVRKRGWTILFLKSESAIVNYWTAATGNIHKFPSLSCQESGDFLIKKL